MPKGQTLQDPFLSYLSKEKLPVSIFLVNGIKLHGHIEAFDQQSIILQNGVKQMVYKHAVSTIVPSKQLEINFGNNSLANDPREEEEGNPHWAE